MKLPSVASPVCIGAIALLMMLPSSAFAQIGAPELPTGGLFGRRSTPDPKVVTQEMTVTLSTGSGYDRNLISGDLTDGPGLFAPQQSGRVSFGSAALGYRWGRATRYLEANGRGYTSYATSGIDQMWNGGTSVRGATELGRRFALQGGARAELTPLYLFSETSASEVLGAEATGGLQPQGITEQKWLVASGNVSLRANWTARQHGEFSYESSQRRPMEGVGFEGHSQVFSAAHSWQAARSFGTQLEYRYLGNRQAAELGGDSRMESHSANFGFHGERRLSATRTLTFNISGGVTHASATYPEGLPVSFVFPNVAGGFGVRLTRSWLLSVSASRNATVLEGYAPEVFIVNGGGVEVSGNLSRRLQLRTIARYSIGDSHSGAGAFDSAFGSIQAQFALTRRLAVFGAYGYYDHLLRNLINVQPNYPDRYKRHSLWAGTTVWLPVFGRF